MKKRFYILLFLIAAISLFYECSQTGEEVTIQKDEKVYSIRFKGEEVADFDVPRLKGSPKMEVLIAEVEEGWHRVRMVWDIPEEIQQDELAITLSIKIEPDFWWAPHLTPEDGYVIAQHVFRSPALIVSENKKTLLIIPDLDICGQDGKTPWFMDFDARNKKLWIGMSLTEIPVHVGYKKNPGMVFKQGMSELGFFVKVYNDKNNPSNPFDEVSSFLWNRYANPLYRKGEPVRVLLDNYVKHTYNWAFNTWEKAVWQEFELDGKKVGAPAFIVNVTESPNYPEETTLREFLSIWNQAWFSSLRSASGLMRYAKRTRNAGLLAKAQMTKEFALSVPMKDGIFPSVYRTEMEQVSIKGKKYNRSKGWETGYWTNSNRTPRERGITDEWYHILDASWTCLLMLRWYEELEKDERLVEFSKTYAEKLLQLQNEKGFFPAWLHPETLEPADILFDSPETSMSVTFLLRLADLTGDKQYSGAALKAIDAVLEEIVPAGRWEDFETYWSCCSFGKEDFLGKKFPRNDMYKQNSFSMFWTAEALLAAFHSTGNRKYLLWGKRTLNELSMCQQVWQPPFIYIPALGGFGVMNFDGEWNDSRQCLFAELFMDYYKETGEPELFERGSAALKSSFVMMYCPENPEVKKLWEKVWPFFGPEDYGFTMENYGHTGKTSPEGMGMGSFTIYDWGNGAAAEARNRIYDHYGDVYIDRKRGHGFGTGSISVEKVAEGFQITDLADTTREIKIVFEDGTSMIDKLDGTFKLEF